MVQKALDKNGAFWVELDRRAKEIERLRAALLRAYKFVSPLSDPLPITNREMAAELMAALEQNGDAK